MTIDRWVAVFTLTVATIALLLSYLTWRSAEKAIRPLNGTVEELRRLTADESLSRQAKALSEVVAGLALISMERSRIEGGTFPNLDSRMKAIQALYTQDRSTVRIALAVIPQLRLTKVRDLVNMDEFTDAEAEVATASREAGEAFNKAIERLLKNAEQPEARSVKKKVR